MQYRTLYSACLEATLLLQKRVCVCAITYFVQCVLGSTGVYTVPSFVQYVLGSNVALTVTSVCSNAFAKVLEQQRPWIVLLPVTILYI